MFHLPVGPRRRHAIITIGGRLLDKEPSPGAEPLEGLGPRPEGPLRRGYTTGACATAATRAAVLGLCTGTVPHAVEIILPRGEQVRFAIHRSELGPGRVLCSVIKDAGDDPDVTHGAEICVAVEAALEPGIRLEGGAGVGTVTKPGLGLEVGGPAINPVPRQMITAAAEQALAACAARCGLRIVVSIPGGEELARRTLNPRLGIVGGLSILGTTGIVEPYSSASYTASIAKGMDVARAVGCRSAVLATGRRTERFSQALIDLPEEAFIEVADFMDFGLAEAAHRGFTRIFVAALVGKLSKMARGELGTHSRAVPTDLGFLAAIAREAGADAELAGRMAEANTARAVLELAQGRDLGRFPQLLAERAAEACGRAVGGRLPIAVLFFDFDGALLARAESPGARETCDPEFGGRG